MAKSSDNDERLVRGQEDRESRSNFVEEERQERGILDMSDAERARFLRDEFVNSALPSIPPIPGFHTIWLSTTNQYDSIMKRQRLGYRPVKREELPQFESLSLKTGEFAGCIAVNEMILFKIEQEAYEALMKTFHHDLPEQEDEKLRAMLEAMKSGNISPKSKPMISEMGNGTEELLRRERRKPIFAS